MHKIHSGELESQRVQNIYLANSGKYSGKMTDLSVQVTVHR